MKKNNAFTLAEIIIALAIVAILFLLVFSFLKDRQKEAWLKSKDYKLGIVKYENVYNSINYGVTKRLMKDGNNFRLRNIVYETLSTLHLKCVDSKCNFSGLGTSDKKAGLSNGAEITLTETMTVDNENGIITCNGKSHDNKINDVCYTLYVDTNGKNKPNKLSQDILPIYIDQQGSVINVNPKTNSAFYQDGKKKYDDSKIFEFPCPGKPDVVLLLHKNPKTGLYEDVNGRKCNCTVDDGLKIYTEFLKAELGTLIGPVVKNGNKYSYEGPNGALYEAIYSRDLCYTNPTHTCTNLDERIKTEYAHKYGGYNSHTITGNNISIDTNYYLIDATYDASCSIIEGTNSCKEAGIIEQFKNLNSGLGEGSYSYDKDKKTVTWISSDTYSKVTAGVENVATCEIGAPTKSGCSTGGALTAFEKALKASKGITASGNVKSSVSGNKITFKYKHSNGFTYSGTVQLGADIQTCATPEIQETVCDNGGIQLNNYTEFVQKINKDKGGIYCLGKDIDFSENDYRVVIQYYPNGFTGELDGQGYKLKNVKFTTAERSTGIFEETNGAKIYDLTIENPRVTITSDKYSSLNSNLGILVGKATNTTIENVKIKNMSISSDAYSSVGGLVGRAIGGTISKCSVSGTIETGGNGGSDIGCLVGYNYSTPLTVSECYSTCDLKNCSHCGGIVGQMQPSGAIIQNSYATGTVIDSRSADIRGHGCIGGLVGVGGIIKNSYATGTVKVEHYPTNSADGDMVGGLAGTADSIINSYATGNVDGGCDSGGLVGYAFGPGVIRNCYATGTIHAQAEAGGLAGTIQGGVDVENCYATGNVYPRNPNATASSSNNTGDSGGLIGYVGMYGGNNKIVNSYSLGNVIGASDFDWRWAETLGGFIGSIGYGWNSSSNIINISNVYSKGYPEGISNIGGFVGEIEASTIFIKNAYATGYPSYHKPYQNWHGSYGPFEGYSSSSNITTTNCYAASTSKDLNSTPLNVTYGSSYIDLSTLNTATTDKNGNALAPANQWKSGSHPMLKAVPEGDPLTVLNGGENAGSPKWTMSTGKGHPTLINNPE